MRKVFVDLDGVLADFDGTFPKLFGFDHRTVEDAVMWEHVGKMPDFFYRLLPFDGARAFYWQIKRYDPVILTACPKDDLYAPAAAAKHRWVREFIDPDAMVLPVLGGTNKPLFMQHPGDILIDDYRKNCIAWEKAGGQAVLHRDFHSTAAALRVALGEPLRDPTIETMIADMNGEIEG
jgi:hypothetical protein